MIKKNQDRNLWALGAQRAYEEFDVLYATHEERVRMAQEWLQERWTDDNEQQHNIRVTEEDDLWAKGYVHSLEKIASGSTKA